MPQAISHVLIPLIAMSLLRDFLVSKKDRKKFPLHYVLLAGIFGLLPDLDVAIYWVLYYFGYNYSDVHRTFSHTLFIPLLFIAVYFLFSVIKPIYISKVKLRVDLILLMASFGSLVHLFLDILFSGGLHLFFPLSLTLTGINLLSILPKPFNTVALPVLETVLLVLWLVYIEYRHKISDFI